MLISEFNNMMLRGIVCTVPIKKIVNEKEYAEVFGEKTVKKIVSSTGIRETYQCPKEQTVCDLGYIAAKELLEKENINPKSVDILIFASGYPDYKAPSTAFVLQKRLGIGIDSIVYDINLGCSGFLFGMQTICSILQASNAKRGILIIGDTTSKSVSPLDKSRLLFGDAGGAVLIEKREKAGKMRFAMRSDGERFKAIIIPAGGAREWGGSNERVLWGDGNTRSDYDLFMNGTDVFHFSITDVPQLINEYLECYKKTAEDYDCLLLHQANTFIIKHLAHKIHFPMNKVPLSLDRYGNSSATTIPVTLCDAYAGKPAQKLHMLMSSFGIGLSWAVAEMEMDSSHIYPILKTDDYYTDAGISHE